MADDKRPSDTVLQGIAARSMAFSGGVSRNRGIRAVLHARGYTQEVHERGWQLGLAAAGYRVPTPKVLESPEAAKALIIIDGWDEPAFRVARAALRHEFPEQYAFVFDNLEAQTGVASVASVKTFLDRLDLLESGKDRKATRKVDQAALAKLAVRGIPSAERARMRGLLAVAQGSSAEMPEGSEASAEQEKAAAKELDEARLAVWRWFSEWSEIARGDIKRRDWLIQLGLAKRKQVKKSKGGDEEEAEDAEEEEGEGGEEVEEAKPEAKAKGKAGAGGK